MADLLLGEGCGVVAGWGRDGWPLLMTRGCPCVPTRSAILLLFSFARLFADLLVPVAHKDRQRDDNKAVSSYMN